MSPALATVLLTKDHDVSGFDCGKAPLDEFLKRYALTNQANSSARTYVTLGESGEVLGYYSLAMGSVAYDEAPERVAKGLARHDIPVVVMGRFAVDQRARGKGLGRALFFDALLRALRASEAIAARAFFVHAKDEEARAFYERFGMVAAPDSLFELFLLFKDVRKTIGL
jgi:GNAT superfamily N-acetyltransferase